jgi:hypothetical protein
LPLPHPRVLARATFLRHHHRLRVCVVHRLLVQPATTIGARGHALLPLHPLQHPTLQATNAHTHI